MKEGQKLSLRDTYMTMGTQQVLNNFECVLNRMKTLNVHDLINLSNNHDVSGQPDKTKQGMIVPNIKIRNIQFFSFYLNVVSFEDVK